MCTLAITSSAVAQTSLIDEDFASATLSTNARIRTDQSDGTFYTDNSPASDWSITGAPGFEHISNAATTTGGATESPLSQVVATSALATNLNSITLSFDYTVGATATLKFALIGYKANVQTGASGGNVLLNNGPSDGAFQNDTQAETRQGDINLLTGADMTQSITDDLTFAAGTSGSHSVTIDLTNYAWHADEAADADPTNTPGLSGSIASIADFDYVVLVVVNDLSTEVGATVTTLDNILLTAEFMAPPPGTWDGETSANWATNTNWVGDVTPVALDELTFSGTANTATNNDLTAGIEFNGISFTNTADTESFSLSGNSIVLGGDISQSTAVSGSISDTISLNMVLNGDRTVNSGADHNLEISGIISEDGSARALTKSGAGTLTLSAANTYTGGTTITGGVVELSNGDALGTGLIEIEAKTLKNQPPNSQLILDDGLTVDEDITVTAVTDNTIPIFINGNGTATLNGLITLDVQTRMEHGGTLNFNGGVTTTIEQRFLNAANFNNLPYVSTAKLILNFSSYSFNVAGNNWSGLELSDDAGVIIGVNNALPTDQGLTIGVNTNSSRNGGSLDLNGFDQEVTYIETLAVSQGLANDQNITGSSGTLTVNQADARTYQGRFTGGISVVKTGVGALTLNNLSGTPSDYTGTFDILDGSVVSQSGADFSDFATLKITSVTAGVLNLDYVGTDNVAALDLGAGNVADGEYGPIGSGATGGESALLIGTGTLTVVAPPTPPLVWDGSTNTDWTNPDANSWTGETYDDGDGVSFLDANASAVTIVGTVAPSSILVDSTVDYTISGDAISGATGLTKSGTSTLTLASANTYTGVTSITSGILTVSDAAALGSAVGNTTVAEDSALRIEGGITLAEPMTIAGDGYVANTGAIQNSGLNTLTGAITLEGRVRFETEGANTGTDTLTLTGGVTGDDRISLIGDYVFSAPLVTTDEVRVGGDGTAGVITTKKTVFSATGNDWTKSVIFFGGSIQLGIADSLPVDKDVEFGWAAWDNSKSSLDLNGFNQTVKSIKQSANSVGLGGDVSITDSVGGGVLTVDTDGPADDSAADAEYQGRITGGLSLVKNGAGILTLNNLSSATDGGAVIANSYTGSTTVNGGTLVLSSADLDNSSTVTIATGATLQLDHSDVDVVGSLVLAGTTMGAGTYNANNSSGLISGTGAIQVGGGSVYDGWSAGFPGLTDSTTTLDFDGGGLETGIEYVVGGNPTDASDDLSLAPTSSYTGSALEFDFRRSDLAEGDSNTLIIVEYGDDLSGWTTAVHGTAGVTITVTDDDYGTGIDRVVVSLPNSLAPDGKLFARLNVSSAP